MLQSPSISLLDQTKPHSTFSTAPNQDILHHHDCSDKLSVDHIFSPRLSKSKSSSSARASMHITPALLAVERRFHSDRLQIASQKPSCLAPRHLALRIRMGSEFVSRVIRP